MESSILRVTIPQYEEIQEGRVAFRVTVYYAKLSWDGIDFAAVNSSCCCCLLLLLLFVVPAAGCCCCCQFSLQPFFCPLLLLLAAPDVASLLSLLLHIAAVCMRWVGCGLVWRRFSDFVALHEQLIAR